MNTRNKEDIPTRNFKRRRRKNIINWRQTTFHVTQKKKKENKTERKKNKKRKTTTKKKQKKIPAKHREKFSNVPPNYWKTNGRGISLSKTLSFNTFSLPNLQNKVTNFF